MHRPQNRWSAAGIHLGLSAIIFAIIMVFMWFYWYPGALFEAAGGWQGVRIIAGVDLVLGPLLTLIVYKASKSVRELTLDLSAIALFQFVCLGAGLYVVVNERPVAMVLVHDTFYAMKQQDLSANNVPQSTWKNTPENGLKFVYVEMPNDSKERKMMLAMSDFMGDNLSTRHDLYRAIRPNLNAVKTNLNDAALPSTITSCYTLKLVSSYRSGTICYNPDTHTFSRFEDIE